MQAYAYRECKINDDEAVETGTVVALATDVATQLLQELIAAGMLPIVMVLRWRATGNHFQAITYDHERYQCYSEQEDDLATKRNEILLKNGCQLLDADPYDTRRTAQAAARELKAIRRAAEVDRQSTGLTRGSQDVSDDSDEESDAANYGPVGDVKGETYVRNVKHGILGGGYVPTSSPEGNAQNKAGSQDTDAQKIEDLPGNDETPQERTNSLSIGIERQDRAPDTIARLMQRPQRKDVEGDG